MADQTKNIHQRLAAITGSVGAIQKTGRNNEQKYDFIEYDAVTGALRKLMEEHGITVLQNMVKDGRNETEITSKYGQKGIHLTIDYIFTVTNVDDPSDHIEFFWQGEAADYGDKATNKTATAAEKYFLLKLFKIGTKEDPDADSPDRGVATTPAVEDKKPETQESAVEFAKPWEIKNLQIAARKITGITTEPDLNEWLQTTLNCPIDKFPRAWVKAAQDKLDTMLADKNVTNGDQTNG